jgi:hypothetical protein
VDLKIPDDLKSEVMHLLAGHAKNYEKWAEGQDTEEETKECERMAEEFWALVRQFNDPGRTGETDG